MAGNKVVAAYVPINERTYIVGYPELMGYLGVKSIDKLNRDYIDKGLLPQVYASTKRWKRAVVDKFIEDHNEWQEVKVRPGKRKKIEN